MTENAGGAPLVETRPDDFEKRLLTMLDSGEIHFPKGAVRPAAEEPPRASAFEWLRRLKQRFPRLLLTAALAYGAALVVSAPVYVAVFSRVPAPAVAPAGAAPSLPAVGSARRLELGAGPTRAAGAGDDLTLAPDDAYVVLSFLVPLRKDAGATYTATLEDGAGRVVVGPQPVRSVDELGNFVLVCRGDLFAPGEYRLTIEGHRFSFRVTRQRR
jgi:hypothetical protein